ncbi:MAG: SUMF1/EgtB/PvdO family nonheme iron enzyme [Anaerolineae bacterium]|nr:SUMF1/EgtB/PvdO family nonheme iron enzyme [Anaerolineae bacterium]
MVHIPAGRFLLGSLRNAPHAHQNELPQHEITLPHYCIGRYPVTNGEYVSYVRAKGVTPPSHWGGPTPPAEIIDHPVTHVSLLEAQAYTEWLSAATRHTYRLPTEQEWEKAARGAWPDNRVYVWGNEWQENACNTKDAGVGGTTAVTHYATTNTSPYGVIDMLGNVWEWTGSDYKPYSPNQLVTRTVGKYVVRGGCWEYEQKYAHVSCRGRYNPGERKAYLGFRLAANPLYEVDAIKLQEILNRRFDLKELRQLAFSLELNHEEIPQSTLSELSIGLTDMVIRHEKTPELAKIGPQKRPDIHWDEAIKPQPPGLT